MSNRFLLGLDKGEKFHRISSDRETDGEKERRWSEGVIQGARKRSRNFPIEDESIIYVKLRKLVLAGKSVLRTKHK